MTTAAPPGDDLLSHLSRLRLRFEAGASLVAMDAHDDPATLEWECRAVLPNGAELTIFTMSGLTLDLRHHDDAARRLEGASAQLRERVGDHILVFNAASGAPA